MKKILILAIVFFARGAFAAEVGRVTYVEGRVDILKSGAKEAVLIKADEPVSIGDFIRTKSDSKAEIVFADESVVRLAQNSRIQIKDYQLNGDKRKTATIMLERGKVRTTIGKMPGQAPFVILTPNAQGVIKGSDIFTFYQGGNSGMLVAEGALSVINTAHPEQAVTIPSGNSVLIPLEELPKGPRPYMDMEKRMEEVDTNVPPPLSRRKNMAILMGTVADFSGDVKIISKGKSSAHPARPNERVEAGDRVQTGKDGIAQIVFDNGNALYLKANTDITITKLISDPETQEYENLFDAKVGKIKARIERLTAKSKFEVRTPTAVCGARGTIMYVGVSETGETQSFFEGGTGFITSLENNETEFVGAGEKSEVTADGTVTDPVPASESEQMSFDEGFKPGTGTEEQSQGSAEGYLYDSGTNTDAATGTDAGTEGEAAEAEGAATEATLNEGNPATGEVFIDIPVTVAGTAEEKTPVEPSVRTGDFYTSTISASDPALTLNGALYDLTPDFNGSSLWLGSSIPLTMTGSYILDDASSYHIWTCGDDDFFSYNKATGTYTLPGGGAFYGVVGGINGNFNGSDKMEGLYIALGIAPDGSDAGIISGSFNGSNAANFTLTGATQYSSRAGISSFNQKPFDLKPEDLYSHIDDAGSFTGTGYLSFASGAFVKAILDDGIAMNIDSVKGKDWGIWGARIAGSYSGDLTSQSWNLQVCGLTESDGETDGAWLGLFKQTSPSGWSGDRMAGAMDGIHLNASVDGTLATLKGGNISGKSLGSYVEVVLGDTGTWQAVGCGEWIDLGTQANSTMQPYLNLTALDDKIMAMNVNVPITVADYALSMSSSGGPVSVSDMSMSFYNANAAQSAGIWAALIAGAFTTPPTSDAWSVSDITGTSYQGNSVSATLSGTQWSAGEWRADVTGNMTGTTNTGSFSGVATGIYSTSTSTFQGTGAGNWSSSGGSVTK
jgi:hypothetical protein